MSDPVTRPSWDQYFIQMAHFVATRSTCLRRQVGALAVKDYRILTTGYNGAAVGITHCEVTGCLRQQRNIPSGERHEICRGLHAEQNAIIQGAVFGVSLAGATIYSTHQPCALCAKMLINTKIARLVYSSSYPDLLAAEMLKEAQLEILILQPIGENS